MKRDREQWIIHLYRHSFPDVARHIAKNGGNIEDAREIFQEALLVYWEKRISENFIPDHSPKAYLKGIASNLWRKQLIKKVQESQHYSQEMENREELQQPVDSDKLLDLLERAGKTCLELLQAFYYEQLNMREVAARFGFQTAHAASVRKYKCLKKIRNQVKEKALEYADFLE